MTVAQLIASALRKIRVYAPGESIDAAELQDNLSVLNSLINYLSTKGINIPFTTTETLALVADQASYTIGSGGDFDTARPVSIEARKSFIRDANNNDYTLEPMTQQEYARIPLKSETGSYPSRIFYDPQFPLGIIYLQVPPTSGLTLYLVSNKLMTSYSSTVTTLSLSPGYQAMLEYNLAVWLADEYGKPVTGSLGTIAAQTLAAVQSLNARPEKMALDVPAGISGGGFNVETGEC